MRLVKATRKAACVGIAMFGLVACTDHTPPPAPPVSSAPVNYGSSVNHVADVQFAGQPTQVLQMTVYQGSLYLTGRPFGLSRWNISADPQNPSLIFAMSDDIVGFSDAKFFGPWIVDWYASGALAVVDGYMVTSGTSGVSVVDIRDTNHPKEVNRAPRNQSGTTQVDSRLTYTGLIAHPRLPYLYGFRFQDSIYQLNRALPNFSILNNFSPGGDLCCTRAAAFYNEKIYTASESRLGIYDVNAQGQFSNYSESTQLQAWWVYATPNMLYVHHEPKASIPSSFAPGIYAFNRSGQLVNYYPVRPLLFAVSDDDRYLYANPDDTQISIYQLLQ